MMTFCVAVAGFMAACGGQIRQLHSVGGNEFTLFPRDGKAPPPITCSGDTDARFRCFVEESTRRLDDIEVAGAFALVAPDGKPRSFARTDGLNANALSVDEDTRFPAASITKMFVAAATVSLSLEAALDLHQPISRYVPELSGKEAGGVTLHQLLTHTSGLPHLVSCADGEQDLNGILKKHEDVRLLAPPGAVSNYSNLGYSFVGVVLERVTGKPFEAVVKERVLIPAGIPGASFDLAQVQVRAHLPEGVVPIPRCRGMWPAGGLVLSIRELAQWLREVSRPEVSRLGKPLLDLLTAAHVRDDGRSGVAYGYGVQRLTQSGLVIYNHAGGLEDFSSFVAWSTERQLGVATLANRREGAANVALRAMSTFLSLSENWQPARTPAHPLEAYAGVYVDEVGTLGRLSVSLEDGRLMIDYLDQPPPLLPAGFRFVFEETGSRARYVVTPVGVGVRTTSATASAK